MDTLIFMIEILVGMVIGIVAIKFLTAITRLIVLYIEAQKEKKRDEEFIKGFKERWGMDK